MGGDMELTFSCPTCGAVGHVSPVETATDGSLPAMRNGAAALVRKRSRTMQLQACPWCMTTDLYIQKDFPQGLGLFIVGVGFAISTVFWYYEMPIPAYLVLVVSILLDLLMYHLVADVTICYRCLCQLRGAGSNPGGRFRTFDLTVGERYRQERIRPKSCENAGHRRSEAAAAGWHARDVRTVRPQPGRLRRAPLCRCGIDVAAPFDPLT